MWHAKYSLSHALPVATTEALNESCKFSRSWTQLTRRLSTSKIIARDNLGFVNSCLLFLLKLCIAKQHKATCWGAEVEATQASSTVNTSINWPCDLKASLSPCHWRIGSVILRCMCERLKQDRHENMASTRTCMCVDYKWFNLHADCTLRSLEWKSTLLSPWNQNWSQSIICKGKVRLSISSTPSPHFPTLQQYPHSRVSTSD